MKHALVVLASMASIGLFSQNKMVNYNPPVQIQQTANPVYASNQSMRNIQNNIDVQARYVQQRYNPPARINDNSDVNENNKGNLFVQEAHVFENDVQDNNVGNSFNQEALSINIPAIQIGSGSLLDNIALDLKLPKINFKPIKLGGNTSASRSSHTKSHAYFNKWHKVNRKLQGKFSTGKKLHFKVDDCFKW